MAKQQTATISVAAVSDSIPIREAAKIPISVVYINDANALAKSKYVSGQVGISYDFSALKKLSAR